MIAEPEKSKDTVRLVLEALEDGKALDTVVLNVEKISSFTDFMVVSSGRSTRQVKSLIRRVRDALSARRLRPIGVEGDITGDWVLLDYGEVVVHIMLPSAREFYQLERLWGELGKPSSRSQ